MAAFTGRWRRPRSPPIASSNSSSWVWAAPPTSRRCRRPKPWTSPSSLRRSTASIGVRQTGQRRRTEFYRPVTQLPNRWNVPVTQLRQTAVDRAQPQVETAKLFAMPLTERIGRTVIVAGTFDTKGKELRFVADRLKALGIPVRTVDLSTSGKASSANVPALEVASLHPYGTSRVMSGDRGTAVEAMAEAFARWIAREPRIGGVLGAGGSGGTTMATAGMRALPVGIPKLMVSTVAAGDVAHMSAAPTS